jgi:uncharacterized protein YggT (Ycf19 family)
MSQGQTRSGILQVARGIILVIYAILMTYVVILLIAFVLRLFGASPTAPFVDWIYTATARMMQPFRGMFPTEQVTSKSVFDPSLLFAMLMYSLLAMLLHAVVDWLSDRVYGIEQRQTQAAYSQSSVAQPIVAQQPGAPSGFGSPVYGEVQAPAPRR